ncbi:MAG: S8 family serine peptidase, partial [Oscillospiraceae bacterium]|nr:S8 family serine peptidase [Oscillospiraceae bacterium]
MQQKHLPRRLLSLLLTLAMLFTLLVPAVSAAPDSRADEGRELELSPLDPTTLQVQKLGETEDAAPAAEQSPYALTDLVRVSIVLEGAATLDRYPLRNVARNSAALAYRQTLRAAQNVMQAKIEAATGKKLAVKWNMTLAANIISANVRYGEIETIRQVPGVARVVIENRYEAPKDEAGDASPNTANTSENMVGAWEAWDLGYTGAGSRVAIIDTGIDTAHQSFAAEPFNYSVGQAGATGELMTQAQVQALANQLNSKTGNYVNAKIPYGYNYVDGNTTIDHMSDTEGNHGSHVAGIAAANRYVGSAHDDAAETVGAVGMAPDAQLFVMKVFGANGGAYDSDYMVAIEDAIVLDCDVVNLSLGSGSQGWTYDGTYQDILNNLTDKAHNEGMVVAISAGNSYDFAYATGSRNLYKDDVYYHTGGSPGTFANSLCVAAAQNTLSKGTPMNFNGVGDVFYYESTGNEEEGTTYTNPALSTIKGSYSYVYIDGVGSAAEYAAVNSALSLSGKIVIVNRGELSFVEKGENAKSYNPKAVIIANNQDGTIYMDLTDFTGSFPMVTITLKDANKIKAASASQTAGGYTVYTGSVEVTDVEKEVTIDRSQATISDFSSWGVPGSLLMKPEITAPGGNIYSVNGTNKTSSGTAGGADQYVSYSGTSMAAPHIAGLSALVAEYLRENPISGRNSELSANYSTRAIIQSLLMSTATPMAPDNEYLSILQQGAGLVEAAKAVQSPSVIMMTDEGNTLTVRTGANADGKIKAELGDDPAKTGAYSFGFKVYNLTDNGLTYELDTDLFSQKISGEFLAHGTSLLPAGGVSYTWNGQSAEAEGHDVDKDGDTDNDDAQAILDYLSGEKAAAELDLTAADLDEDGEVTSRDAYLLIDWVPEAAPDASYTVPAHGVAEVKVTINLSADQRAALAAYAKGAYLEGFTYLSCSDGSEHSIPILGFYGSWTEPSMFDNMSYVDELYGAQRIPYSGTSDTNYLLMNYAGANVKFSGNPYMVEDEFPAQRLAINGSTNLIRISYNLIRSAATTGYAVSRLDADHKVTEVISSTVTGNGVLGQWYYVNQGSWQNTMTKLYAINKTVASYGLTDGELFRVGYYAIPEYNGMVVNESYDQGDCGMLDQTGFNKLLLSNSLGSGAFVGYDFTVDNTAPQVTNAVLNGSTLSVSASDNLNLAYVAVLSLDGSVKYAEKAPGASEYTISFDASEAIANANGYVAVFAGDYAGNEAAVAVKVNDNTHVEKTVYVLTDSLTAGNDYVIAEVNAAGTAHVLGYTAGTWSNTVTAVSVTVKPASADSGNKPYIETADVPATAVWTASSGVKLMNGNYYLRRNSNSGTTLQVSTTNSYNSWSYDAANSRLGFTDRATYLRFYNNNFSLSTATTNKIYLYVKTTISYEVDPYAVSGVSVTPETLDLYKGATADLTAKVTPLTASDRTVSWSSSNTGVATVDQNGHVTAVAKGTATITASSNANSAIKGSCTVTVEAVNKELSAIIWDEEGSVFFSYFNANNLPTWTKRTNNATTLNGNPLYLHNAFMQSASALYASTLDINDTSVIYSINRSTYAATEYGTNYVPAFGMARGPTGFSGYTFYAYGFAKYLILGNLPPETDDELGTFSGFPYGLLDLTGTDVGDAYAVGICARTVSSTSCSYYFLDETGKIWTTTVSYSNGFNWTAPTLVVDTGLGAGLQYQSLYYDGTWIYWSRQADNVSELIMYNPSTGKLYNAGNFGEGVWPAAGLYVNGSAAPASVEEPAEGLELKPLRIKRDELMTAEIKARFAAETEKNEPANLVNGGANAVSVSPLVKTTDGSTGEAENGSVTLTLTETEDVNNGLVTVTYDPAVLTYTGSSSDFAYISVHPVSGVITLAFADKTAHTDLAVLNFSYTGMLNTNVTVHTAQRNTALAVAEDDMVINLKDGSKLVSVYVVDELDGESLYAWAWGNAGNLDAAWPGRALSAEGVDKGGHPYYKIELDLVDYDKIIFNRNGQPQTETLNVSADAGENAYVVYYIYGVSGNALQASKGTDLWPAPGVVTEPTCTESGYTTYTGMFTGETRTGNETPALGHTSGEPVQENVVPATCSAEGSYEEVVYCTVCHEELSRETKTIEKLAHTPGEAVQENVVPATCSAEGSYDEVVYCTVCHEELSRETKTIEKLAH